MTETFDGCKFSDIWVSPDNWKTTQGKTGLKKDWYVQCFFYDPLFKDKYPKGKVYRKRLNRFKTLEERRAAAEYYLKIIPELFGNGYNHITKKYMVPEPVAEPGKLSPETPAAEALTIAWDKILEAALQSAKRSGIKTLNPFQDVKVANNRFIKGLKQLRLDKKPIKDLKVSEVKETIVHIKITDGYYNKFLSYMSKIYTELIEYGCVENNPFKLYKKKRTIKKQRDVLTQEEFDSIMAYLKEANYGFYRYCMIFQFSGARSTELFSLQAKNIDLENQEYRVLIKKGAQMVEEIKVILLDALPYWKELLSESTDGEHYIFSQRFSPGPAAICARQVSRKWNKYIKKRYNEKFETNITADFYALKHFFLDKLDAKKFSIAPNDLNIAQIHASHRSPLITNSVYLVNKKKREREILKNIVLEDEDIQKGA